MTSPITTHVLDLQSGKPAAGMVVRLQKIDSGGCSDQAIGMTDSDGRISGLLPAETQLQPGTYRLQFQTGDYHVSVGQAEYFYPSVTVDFVVGQSRSHYHVPLLLSPFGYSTYRGS